MQRSSGWAKIPFLQFVTILPDPVAAKCHQSHRKTLGRNRSLKNMLRVLTAKTHHVFSECSDQCLALLAEISTNESVAQAGCRSF